MYSQNLFFEQLENRWRTDRRTDRPTGGQDLHIKARRRLKRTTKQGKLKELNEFNYNGAFNINLSWILTSTYYGCDVKPTESCLWLCLWKSTNNHNNGDVLMLLIFRTVNSLMYSPYKGKEWAWTIGLWNHESYRKTSARRVKEYL